MNRAGGRLFLVGLVAHFVLFGPGRADATTPREYTRACIAGAEGALLANDAARAREWLRRVPADERALEWLLLWRESDRSLGIEARLPDAVNDVAVQAEWFVTACADGGIRLHRVGEPVLLARHRGEAYSVAVRPDGAFVASSGADSAVRLGHIGGRPVATILLDDGHRATDLAFSPDGTRLAAALTAGLVRVWNVGDPARPETLATLRGHVARPPVAAIAALADGRVASGSWDQWVKVWDVGRRVATRTFGPGYGAGPDEPYSRFDDLAASDDGRWLYAASARGTHGWSLADSARGWLREGGASWAAAVAVETTEGFVASGSGDGIVTLRDGDTGAPRAILRGHTGGITALAFEPRGGHLYSASADSTVRLWNWRREMARDWRAHATGVWGLAIADEGVVTTSTDDTVSVWERDSAHVRSAPLRHSGLGGAGRGASVVADGGWWIVGTNEGSVYRVRLGNGTLMTRYRGHIGAVQALALARRRLVTASNDGTVRLFDLESGDSLQVFRPGAGRAPSVALDRDGKVVAAGFLDGTVRLFDPEGGVETARLAGPGGTVTAVAIDPAGEVVVAATERGVLRAWSVRDGRERATLAGHQGPTYGLRFTREGSRLVSASYDRTVRIWDPRDWALAGTVRGFPTELYGLAISPEDDLLVVGGADGRVRSFDIGPLHETEEGR